MVVLAKCKVKVVLDEEGITGPDGNRLAPKDLIQDLKRAQIEEGEQILVPELKKYHGVYYTQCQQEGWDRTGSHTWLTDEAAVADRGADSGCTRRDPSDPSLP